MHITNKRDPSIFVIQQVACTCKISGELLLIIDQKLSWNEYILKITTKARQTNTFLCCSVSNCPTLMFVTSSWSWCYQYLNMTPPPAGPPQQIRKICCKILLPKISITSRILNNFSLPTLQQRRKRSKCTMMYIQDNQ